MCLLTCQDITVTLIHCTYEEANMEWKQSVSHVIAGSTFLAVLDQLGSLHLFLKMLLTTIENKMKTSLEQPGAVSYSPVHSFVRLYYHPYK